MTQHTHIITLIAHRGEVKEDARFYLVKYGYSIDAIIAELVRRRSDATELEITVKKLPKDSDNDSL